VQIATADLLESAAQLKTDIATGY